MTTFATPARARAGVADPQRTCVVTRQVRPEHELIRFVLDPCARVVVDLKHRLPGRGVWVTAQRAALEEAVRRKAFARGFRRQVEVDQDLPEQVAAALRSSALGSLGLARKAGAALSGFAKVDALVRARRGRLRPARAGGGRRRRRQDTRRGARQRGSGAAGVANICRQRTGLGAWWRECDTCCGEARGPGVACMRGDRALCGFSGRGRSRARHGTGTRCGARCPCHERGSRGCRKGQLIYEQ